MLTNSFKKLLSIKPKAIISFSKKFYFYGLLLSFLFLITGTIWAFLWIPADYQQGNFVKIMYVHVPVSWLALGIYTFMALSSAVGLITHIPLYFYLTKAISSVGTSFCFLSLTTGMLWGKPTWGTWWVWDARLTSMLILFFLYLGYLNLTYKIDQPKLLSTASIIVVLGAINIPIIKWSVDWWYTLHQPASLLRFAKPAIHHQFLGPLAVMFIGFGLYAITIGLQRLRLILEQRQLNAQENAV